MGVEPLQRTTVDGAAKVLAIASPPDWFLSFARALHELQGTELDWLYLLEKPHKWATEYSAWLVHGCPSGPDDAGWAGFVDELA